MGCREGVECLGGGEVAWRAPSRQERAEQLGGQQVARGRRMSGKAPGAKRTPEGPGGRRGTRRAGSSLDCVNQSRAGVVEWAGPAAACVERCWMRRGAAAGQAVCLVVIL